MVAEEEDTDTEKSKMEIGDKRRSIGEGQAERPTVTWAHRQSDMTFEGQRQQMDGQGNTLIMRDYPLLCPTASHLL